MRTLLSIIKKEETMSSVNIKHLNTHVLQGSFLLYRSFTPSKFSVFPGYSRTLLLAVEVFLVFAVGVLYFAVVQERF